MVDYTNEHFMLPIENEEAKGYAIVNAVLYRDEDGLDFTGSYSVYLLHPLMGTAQFTIHPVDYPPGFRAESCPFWVENEIISEIINEIKKKFNRTSPVATVTETENEETPENEA